VIGWFLSTNGVLLGCFESLISEPTKDRKMHLTITNFRSHSHSRYEIQDGSLVLLSGKSGCGKSTIFQAIYWCLYGSLRDVYPNTAKNLAPCVVLEIGPYVITRRKKPESLQVSWSSGMYEGAEAQSIIDDLFGKKDLWLTTSYLQQGDRCKLLSGSNSDRLDVLNRLSFCSSDPDEVLEKVQDKLGILSQDLTLKSDRFSHKVTTFTQQLHEHPVNPEYASSNEQLQGYKQYLENLYQQQSSLEQRTQHHRSQQAKWNVLKDNIQQVTDHLSKIDKEATNDTLQQLQAKIEKLRLHQHNHQQYIQQKKHRDNIQRQIDQQQIDLSDDQHIVTQEQIWKARSHQQLYATHTKNAAQIGVEYNQEKINQARIDLEQQIQDLYQQKHNQEQSKKRSYLISQQQSTTSQLQKIQHNIQETESSLATLNVDLPDLSNIQSKIQELEQSLSNLECPHCHQQVRFVQGSLQPSIGVDRCDVHNQLATLREQQLIHGRKTQLQQKLSMDRYQLQQLQQQLQSISEQLSSYPETTSHLSDFQIQAQIQDANRRIQQLLSIQVVDQPTTNPETLEKIYNFQQLQQQLQSISISEPIEDRSLELSALQQRYSVLQPQVYRSLELHKQLQSFERQLESISLDPESETQLQTTIQEISNTQQFILESEYTNKMLEEHQQLHGEQEEVQALSQDVEALDDLRKMSIQVECQLLESTVDAINTTMATVLETMFDDPISAKLSLFRTLKTKGRVKPQVNLSISFRGGDYDNINQLSGGEGDRISLALTIALNLISPSPILLLDECLSSLDGHYRESCIRALRLLIAQGKTILCINHEDVEGLYDSTLTDFPYS